MSVGLEVAGQSDLGCVRSNNEDYFGFDERCGIYVVCDGMGGAAAGEVASRLGVESVIACCQERTKDGAIRESVNAFAGMSARANLLADAIQFANHQICFTAEQNREQRGMGSTIAAVLVEGQMYSVGHVGDSRVYLLRNHTIRQLTEDHSLVMEQVRRGLITAEQAQHSDIQNIITRALGTEQSVEPDLCDLAAEAGDTLLLTSDGLTRHLSDEEIMEIIEGASSCKQACQRLIAEAKEDGGLDNITCMILRFVEKSWIRKMLPGNGSA
jgi:protein phosphatase